MSIARIMAAGWLLVPVLSVLVADIGYAHAQAVDYDAYEQLFGEPVTASATGKPQRVGEAPVDMIVITADQISHSGAHTVPDVLQYVAGIDVRRYGMQDAAVGIRGDNTPLNPRVLVLLDGQQVYQDDFGLTVWSTIPVAIDQIRQIEIIKGPNAALYGFNAVSGVINIITRNPLKDAQNIVSAQGGTQNQAFGDAVSTVSRPGVWAVRVAAQGFRSSEFDGEAPYLQREPPHSGMVSVDGRYQISPAITWGVFGSISSLDSDYYTDLGDYTTAAFRNNMLRTNVAWDSAIGDLHVDAYRNEERVSSAFTLASNNYRDDLVVFDVSDMIKTGAHAFRIAGNYRDNDAASYNSFRGHIGYRDAATSGMWEWTITPHVQMTNALRVDDFLLRYHGNALEIPDMGAPVHDAQIVEPSFNSGLVVDLDGRDTLRLSAARAAQLPSLMDFGFQYPAGPVVVSGNSSLAPSEVTNYELDWNRTLPSLSSKLRVSVFAQHTNRTVGAPFGSGYMPLPTGQIVLIARNFGGSDEAGGEVELRGQSPSGLRWNVSYALASVDDHSPEVALKTAPTISYQRQTPTNTVIAGIGYHRNRLDLDLQSRWQSHIQDFQVDYSTLTAIPVTVANNVTMRVSVQYRLTRSLTASATVSQLNHRELRTTAGLDTDRQVYGGLKASF